MAPEAEIGLGTSAFTAAGWAGAFYPAGMKPADYLTYYATQFDTVELDNTFYRTPAISAVKGWNAKTPKGFLFAAKVPQAITHEKALMDCDEDYTVPEGDGLRSEKNWGHCFCNSAISTRKRSPP